MLAEKKAGASPASETRPYNVFRERVVKAPDGLPPVTEYGDYLPDYVIWSFNGQHFKIIRFKRRDSVFIPLEKSEKQSHDGKLDNTFSRARTMVLQYGLCNPWDYFLTITLDPAKYDRYDLEKFRKDVMQWVRDERKCYRKLYPLHNKKLSLLLVPENHKDGAWHMHGFVYGMPKEETESFASIAKRQPVPLKLIHGRFDNWTRYSDRFGFCSLGVIRDQVSAVLYMTKYINKNVEALRDLKGTHLYNHSRPLKKAVPIGACYGPQPELDSFLSWHGEFCSTGFAFKKDWTFPISYIDVSNTPLFPGLLARMELDETFDPATLDPTFDTEFSYWGKIV